MTKYCFFNGKIQPVAKAGLKLNDIGVLRGYGVFEFSRTYNGKPFLFKEHLKRFRNSAKAINLKVRYSDKEIEQIVEDLLKKNKMHEANIRLVLTGGESVSGIKPSEETFYILIEHIKAYPDEVYDKGVKLVTFEFLREVNFAKTSNYINAIKLQPWRDKEGALEILYYFNKNVLEATTSNFFIFKNGTLITPEKNVLMGITRNFVLKVAKGKFKIEVRDIKFDELKTADEAFITATNKEIIPVVQIDKMKIGTGKPGENTIKIMQIFHNEIKKKYY